MKTPHTIRIYMNYEPPKYNPMTGDYDTQESGFIDVPCLANYVTQERIYEQYGSREDKVLIARFMQEVAPFKRAEYEGRMFEPIEQIDAPIKGAVRLREVAE